MTEQPPIDAPIATHIIHNTNQQAGVELNLFFKTTDGFKAHIKLHGEDSIDMLERGERAINWLNNKGWTPEYQPNDKPAEPSRDDLPADGTAMATFCTIHNCEMKRREKDGQVWYSHKIAGTDDWCRGTK